ncbi:MAG: hypothetical protein ABI833_21190 [Acidobacteriota bacterium]
MLLRLQSIRRAIGWVGLVFLLLLAVLFISGRLGLREPQLLRVVVYVAGVWLGLRLLRLAFRRGIWRLRNRLLAAYLFMAVVPVLLIATLAAVTARVIASQLAVYLVTSELDRRIEGLQLLGESIAPIATPHPGCAKTLSRHRRGVARIQSRNALSGGCGFASACFRVVEYPRRHPARSPILSVEPPANPCGRCYHYRASDAGSFEFHRFPYWSDRVRDAARKPGTAAVASPAWKRAC